MEFLARKRYKSEFLLYLYIRKQTFFNFIFSLKCNKSFCIALNCFKWQHSRKRITQSANFCTWRRYWHGMVVEWGIRWRHTATAGTLGWVSEGTAHSVHNGHCGDGRLEYKGEFSSSGEWTSTTLCARIYYHKKARFRPSTSENFPIGSHF